MTTLEKKQIIEKAFKKLQTISNLPLVLDGTHEGKYHDGTMDVEFSYHFEDGRVWKYSHGFGSYWFNKKEWEKTEKSYHLYHTGVNLEDIEELVPSSINVSEQDMATLRIAARLYLLIKTNKLIY